mmetsp:Transcript_59181/g.137813  ORF Transcript_59181/g.137813 Transcript_59181/m.137813 type:complete len:229 (-) Transcript_59181:156-842(-)
MSVVLTPLVGKPRSSSHPLRSPTLSLTPWPDSTRASTLEPSSSSPSRCARFSDGMSSSSSGAGRLPSRLKRLPGLSSGSPCSDPSGSSGHGFCSDDAGSSFFQSSSVFFQGSSFFHSSSFFQSSFLSACFQSSFLSDSFQSSFFHHSSFACSSLPFVESSFFHHSSFFSPQASSFFQLSFPPPQLPPPPPPPLPARSSKFCGTSCFAFSMMVRMFAAFLSSPQDRSSV